MQKSFFRLKTCLCLLDEKKAGEIVLSWLPFLKDTERVSSKGKQNLLNWSCFKQVNVSVVWVNS